MTSLSLQLSPGWLFFLATTCMLLAQRKERSCFALCCNFQIFAPPSSLITSLEARVTRPRILAPNQMLYFSHHYSYTIHQLGHSAPWPAHFQNLVLALSEHQPAMPSYTLHPVITNNGTITKISISSIQSLFITSSPTGTILGYSKASLSRWLC